MWIGLPIICPDLPYARALCGEQAIYFEPHNVNSLHAAIEELNKRRNLGWWPDWSSILDKIPRDWQEVADAMLQWATAEVRFPRFFVFQEMGFMLPVSLSVE